MCGPLHVVIVYLRVNPHNIRPIVLTDRNKYKIYEVKFHMQLMQIKKYICMFSNNDKNQPETWNSDSHWKHRCQHWETKDSNKMRNCSSGQYQCLFPDWELPSVILSTSQPKSTEKKKSMLLFISEECNCNCSPLLPWFMWQKEIQTRKFSSWH